MSQDDIDNDAPFKRQRENKQPITNVSGKETNILSGGTSLGGGSGQYRTVKPRNYKCPNCGGELHVWHEGQCPFCGLERGEYDPNEGSNE